MSVNATPYITWLGSCLCPPPPCNPLSLHLIERLRQTHGGLERLGEAGCVRVKMTVSRCMMVYVHTFLHTCKIQKGLTKELWKVQDDISKSTKNTHHHAQHWIPHPKNQNKLLCIPHLSIQSSIVRSGVLDLLQILATWFLRTWCNTYKHEDAWVCISIIAPLPKSKINKHINIYIYILLCICISISERWLGTCA